jgi:hypothetical protein
MIRMEAICGADVGRLVARPSWCPTCREPVLMLEGMRRTFAVEVLDLSRIPERVDFTPHECTGPLYTRARFARPGVTEGMTAGPRDGPTRRTEETSSSLPRTDRRPGTGPGAGRNRPEEGH